jgi:hypothetical protein
LDVCQNFFGRLPLHNIMNPPLNFFQIMTQTIPLSNLGEQTQIRNVEDIRQSKFITSNVFLFRKDLIVNFEHRTQFSAMFFKDGFVGNVIWIPESTTLIESITTILAEEKFDKNSSGRRIKRVRFQISSLICNCSLLQI